ncbi:MAG: hypothetical protein H6828_01680 [Planctomycetes bacterium]|nr:hypothetical protein [Planctomycetota bacterium]
MARLILDENGERRAFKLRDGKLTLGSGQGCTLTLSSPDVAEVHAELELAGDRATLVPRPGVTPPKIAGKPVTQATTLTLGGSFTLGSATITLQADDAPFAAAAAAPKPVARPRRSPPRRPPRAAARPPRRRPRARAARACSRSAARCSAACRPGPSCASSAPWR